MSKNHKHLISLILGLCYCSITILSAYADYAIKEADPHSYAQPNVVQTTALVLDLTTQFETQKLFGSAELTLKWQNKKAQELILDTNNLLIKKVEALNDGRWSTVEFKLDTQDAVLGAALHIQLPNQNSKVRINYETQPDSEGLQWLEPSQTAGKKYPFMYTQSEPIKARTWIPCQDTPAIRFTYTAKIHTPKELRAVMSADNPLTTAKNGVYEFNMPQKIPSYLVALAVGDIAAKSTGPRTAVFTESSMLNIAAKEFEDTEKMVQITEKLYDHYQWERYDILVLPPSFPVGGMENPRLTFATPTIIAGDKSLVGVIAHELAHSWSGNLVTNAAWRHIWLNEGITTYVQGRIVEAIYGRERANQEFIIASHKLANDLKELPEVDQRLVPDFNGRNPRDVFTRVPYIKGAWFLRTLEEKFGRDAFDPVLKGYFKQFAFKSATTEDFVNYIKVNLIDKYPERYSMAQVNAWLYQGGIPSDALMPKSERFIANDALRVQWLNGTINTAGLKAEKWATQDWQYFLDQLPSDLSYNQMQSLDNVYHLSGTKNAEVGVRWYKHAIESQYLPAYPEMRKHMISIGRHILIYPLYQELVKTKEGYTYARVVYAEARPGYHHSVRNALDKLLKLRK